MRKVDAYHSVPGRLPSIAATEAAKTFGRLVNRVCEEHATYVIERGGQAVAQIGPVERRSTLADFVAFIQTAPRAGEEHARAVSTAVRRHNTPRVRRDPWAR